ncbi:MAG TPA: response regulator transcription factor [Frankiaceae bacterium]|nr:response regulator transcription factor [Frankiaceae bacterium]
MTVRVLIADDQEMVRTGFRLILSREPDIEVVGDAADGRQAVALTRQHAPDVVIMDIRMPAMDGLEATTRIVADPQCSSRVLILTTFDHDEYVYDSLAAGASGFLLKDAPADQLVTALRVLAAGDAMIAPAVTRRLLNDFARRRPAAADRAAVGSLSQREREVLLLMAEGLANSEIAERLVLGEATVKTHIARIFAKLPARDRVQAVIAAYRSGLVYGD